MWIGATWTTGYDGFPLRLAPVRSRSMTPPFPSLHATAHQSGPGGLWIIEYHWQYHWVLNPTASGWHAYLIILMLLYFILFQCHPDHPVSGLVGKSCLWRWRETSVALQWAWVQRVTSCRRFLIDEAENKIIARPHLDVSGPHSGVLSFFHSRP